MNLSSLCICRYQKTRANLCYTFASARKRFGNEGSHLNENTRQRATRNQVCRKMVPQWASVIRPSAAVSRDHFVESCTCHRCASPARPHLRARPPGPPLGRFSQVPGIAIFPLSVEDIEQGSHLVVHGLRVCVVFDQSFKLRTGEVLHLNRRHGVGNQILVRCPRGLILHRQKRKSKRSTTTNFSNENDDNLRPDSWSNLQFCPSERKPSSLRLLRNPTLQVCRRRRAMR